MDLVDIVHYAIHFHSKNEEAALSRSLRLYRDSSATLVDDLFDDSQTKSDTIAILLSCPSKFSKERKKLAEILFLNSSPSVLNMNNKGTNIVIVVYHYLDEALISKL